MMQRKNKPKPTTSNGGYGSGYESNDNNALSNSANDRLLSQRSSSPSKPSVDIASLTGGGGGSGGGTPSKNNALPYERKSSKSGKSTKIAIATVKRNLCGTQPFDKYWLNLDCCGLVCASLTYMLHLYGVYSFGWILLPPWFSVMDEDGYREVSMVIVLERMKYIF